MSPFETLKRTLPEHPSRWLVTGAAGFIGSNLVEALLKLGQRVRGLDNFATGKPANLDDVRAQVGEEAWSRFEFVRGDIVDGSVCTAACQGVDYVLHQAALGSVPRSIEDPQATHAANVTGFLLMLEAARKCGVRRFVYASSSSVYGDDPGLPKREAVVGQPLSPYAASKAANELYAAAYGSSYGFHSIGLRYFNVFGRRQDPEGAYAAVIPKWIDALLRGAPLFINGDGETSRDFCYIENVVQANLLAATLEDPAAVDQVYNIAVGEKTSLNELFEILREGLRRRRPALRVADPVYREFRAGDVRFSLADISRARERLGYQPTHTARQGLEAAMDWYVGQSIVTGD